MKRIFPALAFFLLSSSSFSQGWYIQTTFSPAQSLYAIKFANANTGYTVAPRYDGSTFNIHKTTNAGQSWVEQSSGYTGTRFMSIWIVHPDTVYMSGNYGLIIKTVNGGSNWFTLATGVTSQLWGLQFVNSFTGYVAGEGGRIMKTADAGATWVMQTSGVTNSFSSVHFRNENTGYVSGSPIVVKTANGGGTWVNLNAPYINGIENFREIYFTDDNTGYYVSDLGRILKTTNAGTNWTLLTTGTNQALFSIYFTDPNTAYACGYNGTIVMTTNAGSSWTPQVSPLNEILPDVWFTSALTGYISTWQGKVLKTTNGGVTFIQPISTEVLKEFNLYRNYPNPFNPVTKIRFDIPTSDLSETGLVSLKVHDIVGKEIAVLLQERLSPGTYEITWNASEFPSGIYFVQISVTDKNKPIFSAAQKMILIK